MNLLIGTASNYSNEDVQVFVKSFRRFNQNDELILVCGPDASISMEGVEIWPWRFPETATGVGKSRHEAYLRILNDAPGDLDLVMVSDTRDVLFQNDPFDRVSFASDRLYTFLENAYFRDCPINNQWIIDAYGPEVARSMRNDWKPVSCAGIVAGEADSVRLYEAMMVSEIAKAEFRCPRNLVIDQACHNGLLLHPMFENAFWHRQDTHNSAFVSTIGHTLRRAPEKVCFYDGYVSVFDAIPAVVHQYDRDPALAAQIRAIYP